MVSPVIGWFSTLRLREEIAQAKADTAEARASNVELRMQLERERHERQQLIEQILQMKREGFAPPAVQSAIERPLEGQLDERIIDAIDSRAPRGSKLWQELGRDAVDMLRAPETDISDVVDAIMRGGNPDGFEV